MGNAMIPVFIHSGELNYAYT